jgi:hypothetical protein
MRTAFPQYTTHGKSVGSSQILAADRTRTASTSNVKKKKPQRARRLQEAQLE